MIGGWPVPVIASIPDHALLPTGRPEKDPLPSAPLEKQPVLPAVPAGLAEVDNQTAFDYPGELTISGPPGQLRFYCAVSSRGLTRSGAPFSNGTMAEEEAGVGAPAPGSLALGWITARTRAPLPGWARVPLGPLVTKYLSVLAS